MASASIPTVDAVSQELLAGQSVTAFSTFGIPAPGTPSNANDTTATTGAGHFSQTNSTRGSFVGGTSTYGWAVDFGSSVTVDVMRVWQPVSSGSSNWVTFDWAHEIQWSDDGSAWTTASHVRTSHTVPTGNVFPYAVNTTEYVYTLDTPSTHRYWRLRKSYSAGSKFHVADAMAAWFIDGSTAGGDVLWIAAPDTIDGDESSSDDVVDSAIVATGGEFWRLDADADQSYGRIDAVLGFEDAGTVTVLIQGGDASDWSDAATVVQLDYEATGTYIADALHITWDGSTHRYWRLVLDAAQGVEVFEVGFGTVAEHIPQEPARAILEIYVHDEDASRWGTATWATGPATSTEGIWSGAGWQDVTPQGVTAHIIWGSREPDKGILARQAAASWNVETYDPDRILDPDNADSPYYPQVIAGVPIRISHESTVIRTGYIDRIGYKYKAPDYRGQLLCTDTISLFNQAVVPEDSILGDTLHDRVWDAIEASGIAVGGIPTGRPSAGPGPDIAPLDTDNPRERSVWDHVLMASQEVLWVAYVNHDASLGLRSWGGALDRGREITAANLEDLESVSHEDGLYSVARIQGSDPDIAPIEREAAPLPRYGRRVYERTELTIDPEGHADAVLQERSWPGVRYSPGTIHCWTAADVDYFGSLQIMERVTVTVPGVVSVEGRILGGELWVQHYRDNERGATWQFNFAVATDGSTAIGLTTLVADGTGETLLDDATETDYLEAD